MPKTPTLSTFAMPVGDDGAAQVTQSQSGAYADDDEWTVSDAETETRQSRSRRMVQAREVENTIAFPSEPSSPNTPSQTGFGTLATLSESEDETDGTQSEGTLRAQRVLSASPSASSAGPSGHSRWSTPRHSRWSTNQSSVGTNSLSRGHRGSDQFDHTTTPASVSRLRPFSLTRTTTTESQPLRWTTSRLFAATRTTKTTFRPG